MEDIVAAGFLGSGEWTADSAGLIPFSTLPKTSGVYAFSMSGRVMYVGLTASSLAQRLYFYARPGPRQRTNLRLNSLIREELSFGRSVAVHHACPPSFNWNGFVVRGAEGLEAGMIATYHLPWNVRGA